MFVLLSLEHQSAQVARSGLDEMTVDDLGKRDTNGYPIPGR